MKLAITASTLVTACGVGRRAIAAGLRDERSGLRRNDFAPAAELDTWIGRVSAVDDVTLPVALRNFDCRVNRLVLLALEQDGFAATAAAARERYGAARVGVFFGTSTSGILDTELAVRMQAALDRDFYVDRHSMYAPVRFLRSHLGLAGVATTVSTACSSSAKVFAAAERAIAAGLCDAAVVGGADSLALSTLHGFRSLELLSPAPCRPCDVARNGISIGEAAGFALLERHVDAPVAVSGSGESADAWHMSTPHPEGAGAARAMRAAIASAGLAPDEIDYVNLHGTGTPSNDAAEDKAVVALCGGDVACNSTKGITGHTLGAAGAVEAMISVLAIRDGLVPRSAGTRVVDSSLHAGYDIAGGRRRIDRAMSNSFGFGGSNCSLVFARGSARP